jgi:hypothetical protein
MTRYEYVRCFKKCLRAGSHARRWGRRVGVIAFLGAGLCHLSASQALADYWKKEKSTHFIVWYSSAESPAWARSVLRAAEAYYRRIANNIHYSRYRNFWTWDERVNIIIYQNRETFLNHTRQPVWSKGGALRDETLLKTKMIVTFKQEKNFLDGVLPHEISHLILGDFVGLDKKIPTWFNEGVAQLQERKKRSIVKPFMKKMIAQNAQMPLAELMLAEVKEMDEPKDVALFYAQSLSVVDFIISRYGSSKFGELCLMLKKGYPLKVALQKVYMFHFETIDELEKKWLRYMKKS